MQPSKRERWDAASGLVAFVTGAAGGALERGWPPASEPDAVAVFIAEHRSAILGQSMLFVLSSVIYIWFLGCVRTRLFRAEGEPGRLSTVAFGAGMVWATLSIVAQGFQVGQALDPGAPVQSTALWTLGAMFGMTNLPLALMLVAFAVVTFRHRAFPAWLGWIALASALAQTLLWIGTIVRTGPLAPTGWAGFVLYPMFAVWLLPTTVVMMRQQRNGDPQAVQLDATVA